MAGLRPGHPRLCCLSEGRTWMPGTRATPRLRRVQCQSAEALAKAGTRPGMTSIRIPAARCARAVHEPSAQKKQRAQGKPGARCTRSLACDILVSTRASHHRFTGYTQPSLRNGFNSLFRALPGDRALLPPSLADHLRQLDASVGASGPHDFAVRKSAARLASLPRPPHPASTSVTIAIRPSYRGGTVWEEIADLG